MLALITPTMEKRQNISEQIEAINLLELEMKARELFATDGLRLLCERRQRRDHAARESPGLRADNVAAAYAG
jgi:hypothetical protein